MRTLYIWAAVLACTSVLQGCGDKSNDPSHKHAEEESQEDEPKTDEQKGEVADVEAKAETEVEVRHVEETVRVPNKPKKEKEKVHRRISQQKASFDAQQRKMMQDQTAQIFNRKKQQQILEEIGDDIDEPDEKLKHALIKIQDVERESSSSEDSDVKELDKFQRNSNMGKFATVGYWAFFFKNMFFYVGGVTFLLFFCWESTFWNISRSYDWTYDNEVKPTKAHMELYSSGDLSSTESELQQQARKKKILLFFCWESTFWNMSNLWIGFPLILPVYSMLTGGEEITDTDRNEVLCNFSYNSRTYIGGIQMQSGSTHLDGAWSAYFDAPLLYFFPALYYLFRKYCLELSMNWNIFPGSLGHAKNCESCRTFGDGRPYAILILWCSVFFMDAIASNLTLASIRIPHVIARFAEYALVVPLIVGALSLARSILNITSGSLATVSSNSVYYTQGFAIAIMVVMLSALRYWNYKKLFIGMSIVCGFVVLVGLMMPLLQSGLEITKSERERESSPAGSVASDLDSLFSQNGKDESLVNRIPCHELDYVDSSRPGVKYNWNGMLRT